jgi:hypothetical protein
MTDQRRDDEIIGRALSRAIETIDVNQTPFERSRIATAPARRSMFGWSQLGFAVVGIILAVALGSWLTRPTEGQPGVAASPTAPASPIASVAPTASAVVAQSAPIWVYFARDGLPPIGAYVDAHSSSAVLSSPEGRIGARISALYNAVPGSLPAGVTNPMSVIGRPTPTAGTSQSSMGLSATTQGDLAKVEFDLSRGWAVRGSAQSLALLQQLVYTITEEPGIRRALITEKGKANAVIDQLVVDKPLSREDVFGYADPAKPDKIDDGGSGKTAEIADWRASVDEVAPGLGRFVVEFKPSASSTPGFVAQLARPIQEKRTEDGKWVINLVMPDALWNQPAGEAFHCCPLKAVGKTPIIETTAYPLTGAAPTNGIYRGVGFSIVLDDARPWRVFTLSDPARIIVDVGGPIHSVSDSVAVYSVRPGQTDRTMIVSGAARAFEAHIVWRLKDSAGRVVANGTTLASLGSSAVWGTFEFSVTVPANATGPETLEVFWPSPKDGTELGLVQIPLGVR